MGIKPAIWKFILLLIWWTLYTRSANPLPCMNHFRQSFACSSWVFVGRFKHWRDDDRHGIFPFKFRAWPICSAFPTRSGPRGHRLFAFSILPHLSCLPALKAGFLLSNLQTASSSLWREPLSLPPQFCWVPSFGCVLKNHQFHLRHPTMRSDSTLINQFSFCCLQHTGFSRSSSA